MKPNNVNGALTETNERKRTIVRQEVLRKYPVVDQWNPGNSRGMDIDFGLERLTPGQAIVVPCADPGSTKLRGAIKAFNEAYNGKRLITHHTQKNANGTRSYVAWCQK